MILSCVRVFSTEPAGRFPALTHLRDQEGVQSEVLMFFVRMLYAEIKERLSALTLSAASGRLTERELDEAVELVVEDPGDGPPESIGFRWIEEHFAEFTKVVNDAPAFMWRHLENRYFAALAVLHVELLKLLPEAERPRYIGESLKRHGAWNMTFIEAGLAAGIPRETLAQVLLDALTAAVQGQKGCVSLVGDFLDYGYGDIDWSVLDDAQFVQAVRICMSNAPGRVLDSHEAIGSRIKGDALKAIMIEAADQLDCVWNLDALRLLPVETRVALARRLKTVRFDDARTALFLTELILAKGLDFFGEVAPLLEQIDAAFLYRNVFPLLVQAKGKGGMERITADHLETSFGERCGDAGYLFGNIEEGTYTDRRTGREKHQFQVRVGSVIYVQDRHQHRYIPQVGDRVLFRPSKDSWLTPNVCAVMFYPARYGGEA